jgi:DNA polymerase elongation subunit (family B)
MTTTTTNPTFRIFDFTVSDGKNNLSSNTSMLDDESSNHSAPSDSDEGSIGYLKHINGGSQYVSQTEAFFKVQMFGVNEKGETFSATVENFRPFFYVLVDDTWDKKKKDSFYDHILSTLLKSTKSFENPTKKLEELEQCITCTLDKKKKLYGYDNGKHHTFLKLEFNNTLLFNRVKNMWYSKYDATKGGSTLLKEGYKYKETYTQIYESNIPPLLRFFHIKDISPSGWVEINMNKNVICVDKFSKQTTCTYEYILDYKDIVPLNNKETPVPYKICSFDIEASSSHGDFPVPVKSYKKLASNIIEYMDTVGMFDKKNTNKTPENLSKILEKIIYIAFGYKDEANAHIPKSHLIERVYPIRMPPKEVLITYIQKWLETPLTEVKSEDNEDKQDITNIITLETIFDRMNKEVEAEVEDDGNVDSESTPPLENTFNFNKVNPAIKKCAQTQLKRTIVEFLLDEKVEDEVKNQQLNISLCKIFPKLEGDKVTFIGSTFIKHGDAEPYFNHCIVLNTCENPPLENTQIETYNTEKEVLCAWTDMIQRENPDIIIGYNIFGFDYEFMFRRAEENKCIEEFLRLSRNKGEVCGKRDRETGRWNMEKLSISIASGTHDLSYIKMNGRLQVDLYNFFRREENLTSYKLDYVAGYFIGDYVKEVVKVITKAKKDLKPIKTYRIKTSNMTGLLEGSYVHFEEIGHTVDYYDGGAKFLVSKVSVQDKCFTVQVTCEKEFTLNPTSKKIRWCLAKDDVTPKDIFQMTNGTAADRAVIAKYCIQDCNLVHYLMNKKDVMTGFIEMAKICSVPISFLVLRGQGIKLTSFVSKKCREKDTLMPVIEKGSMDEGYEGAIVLDPKTGMYLDNPVACVDYASLYPSSMISENLSHDTKVWTQEFDLNGNLLNEVGERDPKTGAFIYDNLQGQEYVNVTYDTYKYVRKTPKAAAVKVKSGWKVCRFAQSTKGILPSILEELLKARKNTRKLIPQQTDEFMKNVLDKRQLGYKVTANSLYGQCGAKTSTFYEKDVAAATTSTGRLLLTYAKKVIEECYGDAICETEKWGPVCTKAEYIYGDSVASYTPVTVRVNGIYEICTVEELANKYGEPWRTCKEVGKQDKEVSEILSNTFTVESWTEKGWTRVYRVIRHKLASHKKMVRVLTNTGCVDVTDDHSLLKMDGTEISPTQCSIGTELLHNKKSMEDFSINLEKMISIGTSIEIEEECLDLITKLKHRTYTISICQDYQLRAAYIFQFISNKGYQVSIDSNKDFIILTITNSQQNQQNNLNPNAIKKMEEIQYEGYVYDLTTENHHFAAGVGNMIVHNTDSVFFTFNLQKPDGTPIKGKEALEITIELAQEAGHLASKFLKGPHDLEYEKTFLPFCLLSKKRYVGILYEHDANSGKRKEMGIVLKRRDNAPIVKDIYGGIIDILMKQKDIGKATEFLKNSLGSIVSGDFPMEKLIITKSLRSGYKNPKSIAHKVLADRMTERDPGNKPSSGDRIPFVYIQTKDKNALQGDKIETPAFIMENKLKIDYGFYITNQIMKPVQQVFALVLDEIWAMQGKSDKITKFKREVEAMRKKVVEDKFDDKLEDMKNKEIKVLLFDKYLRDIDNEKKGNQSLVSYFKK